MKLLVIAALTLVLTGCADELTDKPGTIHVQAPAGKCWSGAMGSSTQEGCGAKNVKVEGETIIVANAQKQTPGRWPLTLKLVVDGKVKDTSSTTAIFGIAQVSE